MPDAALPGPRAEAGHRARPLPPSLLAAGALRRLAGALLLSAGLWVAVGWALGWSWPG